MLLPMPTPTPTPRHVPISTGDIAFLTRLVGAAYVRHAADLATLDPGIDPHNRRATCELRPGSTQEVAAVLAYCHAQRIAVVPQGGRTGLSGGAVTAVGELALSLERLNTIEVFDPLSRTAVVGAGVTLAALAARAARDGLAAGIDLGARDSATLGGLVSTNAGGSAAFRHGTMRERVLGLEVVLADGTVLTELCQVRKRNEGLAVERLLIGAEGTLGVVTRIAIALVPAEGPLATALVAVASLPAAAALTHSLSASLTALEIMSGNHAASVCRALGLTDLTELATAPYLLLVEMTAATAAAAETVLLSWLDTALEAGLVVDGRVAHNETQRQAFWRVREDWAVDREHPGGLWFDVSVPLSALADYVAALRTRLQVYDPSLALFIVGHLADGNLHLTLNAATPITARYAELAPLVTAGLLEAGGSFSAEHGIGLEKKATLTRLASPQKQALMRQLKALYDPRGILNPGKVIPE